MERVGLPPPPLKRLVKTALHQAVLDVRLHQVRLLVGKHGVNVDTRDVFGRTPLMLTCMIDNEDLGFKMASIFLKAGTYLNVRDSLGRTALSYACLNGRQDIVQSILKEDVLDISEPDNDGNTPVHHAALSGNPNIVRMLIETVLTFGLNVDKRNKLGYTPLLLACKGGNFVSAYLFLTMAKASPMLRDGELHLNASEWIHKAHRLQMNAMNASERGLLSSAPTSRPPTHTLSFSREYTMYEPALSPRPRPIKSQPNPGHCSVRSSLNSPLVLSSEVTNDRSEVFISGREARQVLLNAVYEVENAQRPSSNKTNSRFSHPSTAKLLALGRRNRTGVPPDIVTLFQFYSDQCQRSAKRKVNSVDVRG